MRPKQIYWTRKLELELIKFIRQRDFIWKQTGNTNHHIQQKYKAYAEFAALVGHGFTARSIRDRWVNIRSTFNHNLNRVNKSKLKAKSAADVYVPCWPLWKPLQFLRGATLHLEDSTELLQQTLHGQFDDVNNVKVELQSDADPHDDNELFEIRQRWQRTDRPRRRVCTNLTAGDHKKNVKCKRLLDELLKAMKPMTENLYSDSNTQNYWFFGKHVTERLNCMRKCDAECSGRDILKLIDEWPE